MSRNSFKDEVLAAESSTTGRGSNIIPVRRSQRKGILNFSFIHPTDFDHD